MPDAFTPEAIRAAVQAAADNPDAPPFVPPSTGGKSVLVFDEATCVVQYGLARMTPSDWAILFPMGRWPDKREASDG